MYIIFDTETTGVPKNNWKDWRECHLIQIGWIIVNKQFNIISSKSFIVKNGGKFNSTKESLDVHHITDQFREENGVTFNEAIQHFISDCQKCDGIVCHGALFDVGLLVKDSNIYGVNLSGLSNINVFDTKLSEHYIGGQMNLSNAVKSISSNFTVNIGEIKEHDALYDSYLCLELFKKSNSKIQMIRKFGYFIEKFGK